jgi:hypothetical protein
MDANNVAEDTDLSFISAHIKILYHIFLQKMFISVPFERKVLLTQERPAVDLKFSSH